MEQLFSRNSRHSDQCTKDRSGVDEHADDDLVNLPNRFCLHEHCTRSKQLSFLGTRVEKNDPAHASECAPVMCDRCIWQGFSYFSSSANHTNVEAMYLNVDNSALPTLFETILETDCIWNARVLFPVFSPCLETCCHQVSLLHTPIFTRNHGASNFGSPRLNVRVVSSILAQEDSVCVWMVMSICSRLGCKSIPVQRR